MSMSNVSAINALASLRILNSEMNASAKTLSTGLRVADASDNPTYWAVASKIRSDAGALGEVSNAMLVGQTFLEVTQSGLAAVRGGLESVRNLLVSAQTTGADRATIQSEIAGLLSDVQSKVGAATLNSENILQVDSSNPRFNATFGVVASFSAAGGTPTTATIDVNVNAVKLIDPAGGTAAGSLDKDRTVGGTTTSVLDIDIAALTDSAADQTTLSETISIIDAALNDVISAEAIVGTAVNRATSQADFVSTLTAAKERAVGGLVNANMEEEAARLAALQTQQQLALEALSISNNNMQSILQLFR